MTEEKEELTLAYYALHYGKDYLSYSIRSIYDDVDRIMILYTPTPSHGSISGLACPDTTDELRAEAFKHDPDDKIRWIAGNWKAESDHRNEAMAIANSSGFDVVALVDFDEIWQPGHLPKLIELSRQNNIFDTKVHMRHLWRGFNHICDDPMRQGRVFNLAAPRDTVQYSPFDTNDVWHFGYARTIADTKYKISIHGHLHEWRNPNWLDEKYAPWPPAADVHPVGVNTWNPKPFQKTLLPKLMRKHPYYKLDKVE